MFHGKRRRRPDTLILAPAWRRRPLTATAMLLLVAFVVVQRLWTSPAPPADDFERYHQRFFQVARVVDGDTFDIAAPDGDKPTTRIRLWGVDTPEVATAPQGAMYFGAEASAYAKHLLEGRTVYLLLSPRRTRGKYGRLLAYVYLDRDGPMFNELLVQTGHAYADTRFPHHYAQRFEALEKHARKVGAGLWANITPERMPEWRRRRETAHTP